MRDSRSARERRVSRTSAWEISTRWTGGCSNGRSARASRSDATPSRRTRAIWTWHWTRRAHKARAGSTSQRRSPEGSTTPSRRSARCSPLHRLRPFGGLHRHDRSHADAARHDQRVRDRRPGDGHHQGRTIPPPGRKDREPGLARAQQRADGARAAGVHLERTLPRDRVSLKADPPPIV